MNVQQQPTISGLRVRTTNDAHVIFHAVSMGILPIISRRLDTDERRAIASGSVYVWEERGSNAQTTGLGIERWTDSIGWGPSRVKDEFLFYQEKDREQLGDVDSDITDPYRDNLIKQTYSVYVETPNGRKKWHLIAYFTQETLRYLRTIDDIPTLSKVFVPVGKYKSARSAKGRPREPHPLTYGRAIDPTAYRVVSPSQYGAYDLTARTLRIASATDQDSHLLTDSSGLAPLTYLQNLAPPRRHPFDEEALMSLSAGWA